jgi:hypothetical protein
VESDYLFGNSLRNVLAENRNLYTPRRPRRK